MWTLGWPGRHALGWPGGAALPAAAHARGSFPTLDGSVSLSVPARRACAPGRSPGRTSSAGPTAPPPAPAALRRRPDCAHMYSASVRRVVGMPWAYTGRGNMQPVAVGERAPSAVDLEDATDRAPVLGGLLPAVERGRVQVPVFPHAVVRHAALAGRGTSPAARQLGMGIRCDRRLPNKPGPRLPLDAGRRRRCYRAARDIAHEELVAQPPAEVQPARGGRHDGKRDRRRLDIHRCVMCQLHDSRPENRSPLLLSH